MKIDLLGIKIDASTKKQILDNIKSLLSSGRSIFIATPYSESVVRAQADDEFKTVLNSADICLPDGIGILWAAHYLQTFHKIRGGKGVMKLWRLITSLLAIIFNPGSLRYPIPEKISGSDFIWDLAKLAATNNYSIFLLGGLDDTPELVAAKLKSKFPNLKIAGTNNCSLPIYRPINGQTTRENEEIIDQINSSGADFLFCALGPVRQEKWIFYNRDKFRVKLAIGLGGTFDYLAGKRALAPQIWRDIGLEWLWRLLTQPKRLWRIAKGVIGLVYLTAKSKSGLRSGKPL